MRQDRAKKPRLTPSVRPSRRFSWRRAWLAAPAARCKPTAG